MYFIFSFRHSLSTTIVESVLFLSLSLLHSVYAYVYRPTTMLFFFVLISRINSPIEIELNNLMNFILEFLKKNRLYICFL